MDKTFKVKSFEDFSSQLKAWLWLIIPEIDIVCIEMQNIVLEIKTNQSWETFYPPVEYLFKPLIPSNQTTPLHVSITWAKS